LPDIDDEERCVACDKVLEDGNLVYYEHSEGGHICVDCCGSDPLTFVDHYGNPLQPGDPVPSPFHYRKEPVSADIPAVGGG